jgi:hypothetical protein
MIRRPVSDVLSMGMDTPPAEPWDFDVFVRHYNEIAKERGGWVWPSEIGPDKLRSWYAGGSIWTDLRDFARTRYQLDQEV